MSAQAEASRRARFDIYKSSVRHLDCTIPQGQVFYEAVAHIKPELFDTHPSLESIRVSLPPLSLTIQKDRGPSDVDFLIIVDGSLLAPSVTPLGAGYLPTFRYSTFLYTFPKSKLLVASFTGISVPQHTWALEHSEDIADVDTLTLSGPTRNMGGIALEELPELLELMPKLKTVTLMPHQVFEPELSEQEKIKGFLKSCPPNVEVFELARKRNRPGRELPAILALEVLQWLSDSGIGSSLRSVRLGGLNGPGEMELPEGFLLGSKDCLPQLESIILVPDSDHPPSIETIDVWVSAIMKCCPLHTEVRWDTSSQRELQRRHRSPWGQVHMQSMGRHVIQRQVETCEAWLRWEESFSKALAQAREKEYKELRSDSIGWSIVPKEDVGHI